MLFSLCLCGFGGDLAFGVDIGGLELCSEVFFLRALGVYALVLMYLVHAVDRSIP